MTRKWRTGFFLFMYSVITKVLGSRPPTFIMHDMCNQSYPDPFTEWKGGFLKFNSRLLPVKYENECAIFLRTTSSQGIVINFSRLMFIGDCDTVNLTIVDGELQNKTHLGKSFDGLQNPACSSNRIPTNMVYASTESIINIVYKGKSRYRVKFRMMFLSYFKGPCDDDDMFECDNGWCIDKKFTCLGLNPCGDKSDCRAAEKTVMDYILMGAKYLSIILSVAAACYMLIRYCKSRRRRHRTFEDIQIFTWCHRKLCCSSPRDQERRPSISSRHSHLSLRDATIVMERRSLSQSSSVEEHTKDNRCHLRIEPAVPPPSYHDLPPTSSLSEIPQPDIFQPDIPKPDISQTDKLQPDIPKPDIYQTDKLQPDIPKPDISQTDKLQPDIPKPNIYQTDKLQPDIPKPDISQTDKLQPDIPKPNIYQTDKLQPDIPKPDISQTDKLQPDIPKPDITQPDKPQPDIPQPDKPQSDMPLPPSYDDAIANSDIYVEEK